MQKLKCATMMTEILANGTLNQVTYEYYTRWKALNTIKIVSKLPY